MNTKSNQPPQDDAEAPLVFSDLPALYEAFATKVFHYHYVRVQNLHAAEDLTSQTFLSAWENWQRLRDPAKAVGWLFTIARNKAADYFRENAQILHAELDDELTFPTDRPEDVNNTAAKDGLLDLREQLRQLPERDLELLRLRLVGELPFREIARVMNQPLSRIKKRYYRLLERLQARQES